MANYIRIRKENVNIAGSDSDLLIGNITACWAGTNSTLAGANTVVLNVGMDQYQLTATAAAADWAKDIQKTLTANPGGMVATVIPSSTVKITNYTPVKQV